ncbi:ribonuclease H-like domain-containing protein [Tanacetum coccineum]
MGFRVKYMANGNVERFKAWLVAKGFNQREGIGYEETFSPIVKIVTVSDNGFVQSMNNFSIFVKSGKVVILVLLVYVDDIIAIGNNLDEINKFQIVFCLPSFNQESGESSSISWEFEVLDTVISKFGDDEPFTGITHYQTLVGKLIYLTMTRPDISYAIHCLSHVMHSPMKSHLRLAFRFLRYLKREPGLRITFKESNNANLRVFVDSEWAKCKVTRRSVTGYSVFLGNSLVSWKSKKQDVVSRSSN